MKSFIAIRFIIKGFEFGKMGGGWQGDRKRPSGDERIELERKQRLFFKENKSIISVLYMTIIILFCCLISLYLITWLWVTIFSPPDSISTWAIFIILQCWCLVVSGLAGHGVVVEQYYSLYYKNYEILTVVELKGILRKKGLPLTGKKSVLIQRIVDSEKMTILGWIEWIRLDLGSWMIIILLTAAIFFEPAFLVCGFGIIFFGVVVANAG